MAQDNVFTMFRFVTIEYYTAFKVNAGPNQLDCGEIHHGRVHYFDAKIIGLKRAKIG